MAKNTVKAMDLQYTPFTIDGHGQTISGNDWVLVPSNTSESRAFQESHSRQEALIQVRQQDEALRTYYIAMADKIAAPLAGIYAVTVICLAVFILAWKDIRSNERRNTEDNQNEIEKLNLKIELARIRACGREDEDEQ